MKCLITILLLFIFSCTPDFGRPRYKKSFQIGNTWERKQIPTIRQDIYRDHRIKKEQKRKLIQPKIINLDKW